jgi:IclR family transcriptional regulator, acetate operon repressor
LGTDTTLRTVERALQVLEIVAARPELPQVRDVADELGHNLSSTYHLVNTLIGRGYLVKNEAGRLAIGRKIGVLNSSYVQRFDFGGTVRPLIAELAATSGETVYLTRFIAESSVIEVVQESKHSLRVTGLNVGYSGLEDRRASGKAVLAQLGDAELQSVFARLHPELTGAAADRALGALRAELVTIRDQGYAFDNEDFDQGVCCIAAPYFVGGSAPGSGRVGGAVAVSAPAVRIDRLNGTIRDQVLATAQRLTDAAVGL